MVDSTNAKTRVFDVLAIAIVVCLFAEGYLIAMLPGRYAPGDVTGNCSVYGVLVLVSFLGVFYSFRTHTRLLWLIATPLFVVLMPICGNDIYMRLNRAPGEEDLATIAAPKLAVIYLGLLLTWLLVRGIGLRLQQKSNSTVREQTSLQELMAIISIVAVLLITYKNSLRPEHFQLAEVIGHGLSDRLEMLTYTLGVFAIFGGLIAGLLSRRRIWGVAWLLLLATAA